MESAATAVLFPGQHGRRTAGPIGKPTGHRARPVLPRFPHLRGAYRRDAETISGGCARAAYGATAALAP